jgi:hypothetical protein
MQALYEGEAYYAFHVLIVSDVYEVHHMVNNNIDGCIDQQWL